MNSQMFNFTRKCLAVFPQSLFMWLPIFLYPIIYSPTCKGIDNKPLLLPVACSVLLWMEHTFLPCDLHIPTEYDKKWQVPCLSRSLKSHHKDLPLFFFPSAVKLSWPRWKLFPYSGFLDEDTWSRTVAILSDKNYERERNHCYKILSAGAVCYCIIIQQNLPDTRYSTNIYWASPTCWAWCCVLWKQWWSR